MKEYKSLKIISPKIIKYDKKKAQKEIPTRKYQDNKTHGGKCLVVAGSKGLYGSAILTSLAASRAGAGYTYLISSGKFPVKKHPDFLLVSGHPKFKNFQAIAMGPGFRNPKKIKSYLKEMIKQKIRNVVLDAEALNFISNKKLPANWIVTPHEGELSRILKVPSEKIRADRKKYISIAQKKLGCVVLLKGYRTLVADSKSVLEIQSGNPALAKAGTGDVLTGMILAFLSQGLSSMSSAALGSFVHGFIADNWMKSGKDVLSLMASDVVEFIPEALFKIRK